MAQQIDIDFSRFAPELLQAIQEAANFSSEIGISMVTPCILLGALVNSSTEEVRLAFERHNFNFAASMELIPQGMVETSAQQSENGIDFSDKVIEAFATTCRTIPGTISIEAITEKLLIIGDSTLQRCLVIQQTINTENIGRQNNNMNTEAPTGATIRKYCIDMVELANKGKYHHAIGREKEVDRVLKIIARSTKNNPVLVGDPGTGKTAIAEEIALKISEGQIPNELSKLKLFSLDFTALKSKQDSLDILKKIIDEANDDPNLILFIDEIHMLISNSSCSDNDVINLLKPAMARGNIKIFGATTIAEYKRIEKDAAFERRFQKVIVDEPDIESSIQIIEGTKKKFEEYHEISIPSDVSKAAVTLSTRYLPSRKLPDKAFDLIDEAAANLRIDNSDRKILNVNDLRKVVTAWTGIPIEELDEGGMQKLQNIENVLHSYVIGQDRAIKLVADAIRRSRMGLSDPNKPIGNFLFLGTTGTGKTELCKAIAQFLFNDSEKMVRIDMSEFQQEHSSARLIGAPPGYVGYDQGGQLTEAVRQKPYSVILFDEIEKAHPKIFELLYQLLDDGRLTDGKGNLVNFKNTIIVMTSNLGESQILSSLCGRQVTEDDIQNCTNDILQHLRTRIPDAFLNRIDNTVMFLPLSKSNVTEIAELNLKKELKKLQEKGISVELSSDIKDYIANVGYEPEYGGRPIKRAITNYFINPLTTSIVNGILDKNQKIFAYIENNKINFTHNGTTERI